MNEVCCHKSYGGWEFSSTDQLLRRFLYGLSFLFYGCWTIQGESEGSLDFRGTSHVWKMISSTLLKINTNTGFEACISRPQTMNGLLASQRVFTLITAKPLGALSPWHIEAQFGSHCPCLWLWYILRALTFNMS